MPINANDFSILHFLDTFDNESVENVNNIMFHVKFVKLDVPRRIFTPFLLKVVFL